jgi:hypothetical protein
VIMVDTSSELSEEVYEYPDDWIHTTPSLKQINCKTT